MIRVAITAPDGETGEKILFAFHPEFRAAPGADTDRPHNGHPGWHITLDDTQQFADPRITCAAAFPGKPHAVLAGIDHAAGRRLVHDDTRDLAVGPDKPGMDVFQTKQQLHPAAVGMP